MPVSTQLSVAWARGPWRTRWIGSRRRSEDSRKRAASGCSASDASPDEAWQDETVEEKQPRRVDPETGALAE
eukprot:scaffold32868_cov57-Phaeocystis_antarctica.AAC.3